MSNKTRSWMNLAVVCAAAVVLAGGVVGWMAYSHGDRGKYTASNVLLAPDLLVGRVALRDSDVISRLKQSWVFDSVEILHGGRKYQVDPKVYDRFYSMLGDAKSLREPREKLEAPFARPGVVSLYLNLKPQGPYAAAFSNAEFQEVQIAPYGGLVRVELHEHRGVKWAYFHLQGAEKVFR